MLGIQVNLGQFCHCVFQALHLGFFVDGWLLHGRPFARLGHSDTVSVKVWKSTGWLHCGKNFAA